MYNLTTIEREHMINKRLTRSNMQHILETRNGNNREMLSSRWKRYVKDIQAGTWDFDLHEGHHLIFDHQQQLLSGQHRLKAMLEAGVESWDVTIEYVDRSFWLAKSQEKRTTMDKTVMAVGDVQLPKVILQALDKLTGSYSNHIRGFASTSGASGKYKLTTEQMLEHVPKAREYMEEVPKYFFGNKELVHASFALYVTGYIQKNELATLVDPDTTLGSAVEWLIEEVGLGSQVRQVAYATAVLVHALQHRRLGNYREVPDSWKIKRVPAGKYVFDTFK